MPVLTVETRPTRRSLHRRTVEQLHAMLIELGGKVPLDDDRPKTELAAEVWLRMAEAPA